MEISNQKTIFLGTGELRGIERILIYNTECFSGNFNIYLRGEKLQEKILSELHEKPTESSVKEIYIYLTELEDEYGNKIYKDIPSTGGDSSSVGFNINLKEYDYFSQGFNVILYLSEEKEILGFTIFDEPRGKTVSDNIKFERYYSIDNIILIVNYTGIIDINGDTINLVGEISDIAGDLDLTGKENYNYNTLETVKKENLVYHDPVYSDNINFLVKNHHTKNLLLSSFYYRLGSERYNTKLPLRSITLPGDVDFNKYQVGFYKGDIVLYAFKDYTYYIISLTKTGKGSTYTVPKKDFRGEYISMSHYYVVPDKAKIDHFSGGFIYTTDNRIFSIQDQSSPRVDTGINNAGWLKDKYIVDIFDLSGKIYKVPEENIIVRREAEEYFPGISSVYLDIENYLKYYTLNVIGKCGDWYIIKETLQSGQDYYIYTSMTKTIKFLVSENVTPMIVNNEVLMIKKELSSSETEYTFFNEPGNYIYGDTECLNGWKRSEIIVKISNNDSPSVLQTSYFSRFRRNILPDTLINFDIIAAFGGLIFYKKDLNISYL